MGIGRAGRVDRSFPRVQSLTSCYALCTTTDSAHLILTGVTCLQTLRTSTTPPRVASLTGLLSPDGRSVLRVKHARLTLHSYILQVLPGKGVKALVGKSIILVGNRNLIPETPTNQHGPLDGDGRANAAARLAMARSEGRAETAVVLIVDGVARAVFGLADEVRDSDTAPTVPLLYLCWVNGERVLSCTHSWTRTQAHFTCPCRSDPSQRAPSQRYTKRVFKCS